MDNLKYEDIRKYLLEIIKLIPTKTENVVLLDEKSGGYVRFCYPHLLDMLELIKPYGNYFVLLSGSQVDFDVSLWDASDRFGNLTNLLNENHIIKLYDSSLATHEGYLIALETLDSDVVHNFKITADNITQFIRK